MRPHSWGLLGSTDDAGGEMGQVFTMPVEAKRSRAQGVLGCGAVRMTPPISLCDSRGAMKSLADTSPLATVMLVEDDEDLRSEMAAYLEAQGYAVHQAPDTTTARAILAAQPIQAIVLDVNLPGEDGLSLCRKLAEQDGPPILMLSAMGESIDRILGLELGADDYVVKPITPRELLARIKALLRRRPAGPASARATVFSFAGFRLDIGARQLKAPNGMILLLTPGELLILGALCERAKTVAPREDLIRLMRGEEPEVMGRAVDLHISRLRRKIEAQAPGELIRTYRGVGYMLDAETKAE